MTGFAFAYAVVWVCGGQPRKNPGAPFFNSWCHGVFYYANLYVLLGRLKIED